MKIRSQLLIILLLIAGVSCFGQTKKSAVTYPAIWFAPINDPNKPEWEILPQEARDGEVILSKRNEFGILSNFAATRFELYGKQTNDIQNTLRKLPHDKLEKLGEMINQLNASNDEE